MLFCIDYAAAAALCGKVVYTHTTNELLLTEGVAKGVQKWIYRKWPNFTKLASSTPLGVRNSVPKNFWNRISTLAGNSIFRNLVPWARIQFQILECCPGGKFWPIWERFGPSHIGKVPKKGFLPFPGIFSLFIFSIWPKISFCYQGKYPKSGSECLNFFFKKF